MDSKLRGILHTINRINIDEYATDFWTCADSSAKWFYPDIDSKRIKRFNNAIDLESYKYDEKSAKDFKKSEGLEKKKIITNIGRIHFQKNQRFILDLAEELRKEKDIMFLLVGNGEEYDDIKNEIKDRKLDNVKMLGERSDITKILSGTDLFLFPSEFEGGTPIALCEAEASGAKSIASKESFTDTRKLPESIKLISLTEDKDKWVEAIKKSLKDKSDRKKVSEENIKNLKNSGFDIKKEAKKLEEILL